MRKTPARRPRDETEPFLQVQPVDLVDHAVDVERQVGAGLLDRAIVREHRGEIVAADEQFTDRNAEALDPLHRLELAVGQRLRNLAPAVGEEAQRSRRRDARVLLAQRPGGGVARIGEDLASRRFLPLVERLEVRLGHVHLAADLQHVGRTGDALRNVGDRPHIGGHVLADRSVPARRREDQLAALVPQRAGQPVDLRLGRRRHEGIGGKVQEPPHPRDELAHLILGKGVLQAEHRPRMCDLGEGGRRRRAQPLRWGIGADQMREALLQLAVLADQSVIVRVADLRRVPVVVELVVARDFLREPHQPIGGIRLADRVGSHAQPKISSSRLMKLVHDRSAASSS